MKHLFSLEGEAALAAVMHRKPLLAFDFDGTLAPIVARPDDVRVPIAIAQRLQFLVQYLSVAVISGRRVDDVRRRLRFVPTYIVGNHGAEDPDCCAKEDATQALEGLRRRLRSSYEALRTTGVWVEDKGASIALHYRLARDRQAAMDAIAQVLDGLEPDLAAFGGKMVMNIVSSNANDKAKALAALVERSGAQAAVFVGDDVNDEPVFARGEASWLTIRLGRDDPYSQAQFFLDSPADVPMMLDRMLEALESPDEL